MLRAQVSVTGDENEVRTAAAWAEQLALFAFCAKCLQFFRDIDLLAVDYRINAFDTDVIYRLQLHPFHRRRITEMPIPAQQSPVVRTTARERVFKALQEWIIDGTLLPEERLNDAEQGNARDIERARQIIRGNWQISME